jgi:hypothetical protein
MKEDLSEEAQNRAILDQDLQIIKRNEIPIANFYLKFSHIDKSEEEEN